MASDWAGETANQLEAEFGICTDRALRFTTLVRFFVSKPEYEGVLAEIENENRMLIHELPQTLRNQPGDTVEDRWNTLMDELDAQQHVDAGVYFVPWAEHDPDHMHDPGVTTERPE